MEEMEGKKPEHRSFSDSQIINNMAVIVFVGNDKQNHVLSIYLRFINCRLSITAGVHSSVY